ncbi:MAG: hypothetical protein ACJ715_02655, partial [Ornithinibacter sp.]
VCRGCGWVGEAPLSAADELVARLDESLGFASDVSHAAVHGLCRRCRHGDTPEEERLGAALHGAAPAASPPPTSRKAT